MIRITTVCFVLVILLISNFSTTAQLTVLNPQRTWQDDSGSVDNIEYEIRPHGTYAEVSIAFDVSAKGSIFEGQSDPLEFVYDFNMPKSAVFNDSWLWIDNYISEAIVHDKRKGTEIYESIVDRQQDPSILTKHTDESYSLRIYPLDPDSTRRVRLSYYIPIEYSMEGYSVFFPTELQSQSEERPTDTKLRIYNNANWAYINFEFPDIEITQENADFIEYTCTENACIGEIGFRSLVVDKNLHFGTYEEGDDNYFQLMYKPDLVFEKEEEYKLFILDYDGNHTNMSQQEIIQILKEGLLNSNQSFYFNIMVYNFGLQKGSEDWILATDENIEAVFEQNLPASISQNSKLEFLLPEGLRYISDSEKDVSIYVLSLSTDFIEEEDADIFIDEINYYLEMIDNGVTISISDLAVQDRGVEYVNNIRYTGNEYLYNKLISQNNGSLFEMHKGEWLSSALSEFTRTPERVADDFNIDIEVNDGFTYGYFNITGANTLKLESENIITGKYFGTYPFEIELNGIYNGQLFSENIIVESPNLLDLDVTVEKNWFGEYLLENEFSSDNGILNEVVEISKEERLLSAQTVFLCLEPDLLTVGENGEVTTATEELINSSDGLKVYPNPFVDHIIIERKEGQFGKALTLELYTMEGLLIDQQINVENHSNNELSYTFSGMSSLPKGIYVLRIKDGNQLYYLKVTHI